jgi:hypothetical protein
MKIIPSILNSVLEKESLNVTKDFLDGAEKTLCIIHGLPTTTEIMVECIDRLRLYFPYDLYIECDSETPYPDDFPYPVNYVNYRFPTTRPDSLNLKRYDSGFIQTYKHFECLQRIPAKYENIVKLRNDVLVTYNTRDTVSEKLVLTYSLAFRMVQKLAHQTMKHGITYGFGPFMEDRTPNNILFGEDHFTLWDFILIHKRNRIRNPDFIYRNRKNIKDSYPKGWSQIGNGVIEIDPHWLWAKCLGANIKNAYSVSFPIRRILKNETFDQK